MFYMCARQGALTRRVRVPLQTRSGELLADGKGVQSDLESEGSRYGKALVRRTESACEADVLDKEA